MANIVSDRLLCAIGRAPGTDPAPDTYREGSHKDEICAQWEGDFSLALANVAFALEVARRKLVTRALLDVLGQTSTSQIPPLGKRQYLERRGLIRAEIIEKLGHWDVAPAGHELIRSSAIVATISEETVRAILARHGMAV